uniref:thioredoxin-dependent peroxiredoxin n=1 Tax=Hucho hucho TaxID=62062 RepID=A0A4W5PRK1_9TELE
MQSICLQSCIYCVCNSDSLSLPLLCRINTESKQGGLGPMKIPLLADPTQAISRDYGVLKEDEGIAYRGLFVIDDKGILRQIPINDLPVGCSVDETLHLVQAFQHTDKFGEGERRRGQRAGWGFRVGCADISGHGRRLILLGTNRPPLYAL